MHTLSLAVTLKLGPYSGSSVVPKLSHVRASMLDGEALFVCRGALGRASCHSPGLDSDDRGLVAVTHQVVPFNVAVDCGVPSCMTEFACLSGTKRLSAVCCDFRTPDVCCSGLYGVCHDLDSLAPVLWSAGSTIINLQPVLRLPLVSPPETWVFRRPELGEKVHSLPRPAYQSQLDLSPLHLTYKFSGEI